MLPIVYEHHPIVYEHHPIVPAYTARSKILGT
jgi:hypothetical protein